MTVIVSDLHIDNGRGDFSPFAARFHTFLDHVGAKDLIINGDFLDLWRWRLSEILDGPNKLVIERIREKRNVSLILGNHDFRLDVMRSVFQREVFNRLDLFGWSIFHGYQADPTVDTPQERWVAAAVCRVVETANISWLSRAAKWAATANHDNEKIKAGLVLPGRYIIGHTHTATHDGWYVNDGACCIERMNYVELDSSNARLKTWEAA
jgi:predicted phosphodiesterase